MYKCPKCGMEFEKPGKCTMDGATLVKVEEEKSSTAPHKRHDHSEHHKHMAQDFKKRFIISAIVTIPVLILSPLIQNLLGFSISFMGDKYVLWILSSFVFFYGGYPFLKGLFSELKNKNPGMMTLIAVAISVAYVYSTAVVFGLKGKFFFWELVTLIDVMLIGHFLEMKSVLGASKALEKLAQLMPDTAHLVTGGDITDIKISELKKGNIVLVKAGEKIPADGIITDGDSYIDESMLTGESKPVQKKKGDKVIGGSINGDKILKVKVEGTGEESYLNKVINLVKDAQASKSKTQRLADVAARWLTIIAITTGVITFVYWVFQGDLAFAIERMATVMVIACPHALGLAIPLVTAVSTSISAKNGLLIRNRTAFENSRKITTVLFDKTGTLTEGKFGVSSIKVFDNKYDENNIIKLSASIEKNSEHPIAKGILEKANGIKLDDVKDFKVLKGEGIEGKVDGKKVTLLSKKALEKRNIALSEDYDDTATLVFVLIDDTLAGVISLSDQIRKESFEAIESLRKVGIKSWMLTGDNKQIAKKVSGELGLDGFFAEVLPHEKLEKVKELQERGEFVAMTGDGINDAPALAQADVGIAIGSGTDVAAETADIILVNSNPKDVTSLVLFGKATYNKMVQNLWWATGYNAFAIPLAAGVLIGYGIVISPAVGAALMSLSTVIVAINAKFLKVKK
ncbi:cadmium-translocating P-type ATPase [Candidatus Woesearchaeota archaeon]|nr:cadmium-translocating P-type ATPase [Candidatus Woesearchaeota archaeon]